MINKLQAILCITAISGVVHAAIVTNLVAGWETWATGVNGASYENGAVGSATNSGNWYVATTGACQDGDYGTWGVPMANTNKLVTSDGFATSAAINFIDFTIVGNGSPMDLQAFHFDAACRGGTFTYQLEVLTGSAITVGVVTNGAVGSYFGTDFLDFDNDLSGLADSTLLNGESVTFRLSFERPSGSNRLDFDNVGVTAAVQEQKLGFLVGWDNWGSTINDTANRNNGASGVATNTGGFSYNYSAASTDGTFGSLSTNVALASEVRGTNSTTHYEGKRNSSGGNGYFDFTIKEIAGMDADLAYFHFDMVGRGGPPADDWTLEVMPGSSITAGLVANGTIAQSYDPGFGGNNDAFLGGLADSTLEAGGTVIFRLTMSGGTGGNLDMDNVAVSQFIPVDEVTLAAWEYWPQGSLTQPASRENGITASAKRGNTFNYNANAANYDGTFGNFRPSPLADTTTTNNFDGFRATSATDTWIDFTVVNTSEVAIAVNSFRFDAMVRGNANDKTGPTNWNVEVVSGSLTPGVVGSGDVAYGFGNLPDFGVLLNGLDNNFLDAGSTNVIRLNFIGGTVGSGKHLDVDNVAITIRTNSAGPVDLNSLITVYTFNPAGTSTLTFEGGASSDYLLKSTLDLVNNGFTTVTPTAATTGTLAGDVITTDVTGEASVEFTETSDKQFYKIETAP